MMGAMMENTKAMNKAAKTGRSSSPVQRPILHRILLLSSAACLLISLSSCSASQAREDLARRMAAEESVDDDARIAELKRKIKGVESQVEKTIESVRDEATYWRLLGLKYMDYSMWGKAMEAFEEAVAINPDHAPLLYNRALCAGQLALAAQDSTGRSELMKKAETGYRRAIAVDSRYTPAMYGLAVVLAFEAGNPGEAAEILEDYLKIERSDMNAKFLLARCYLEIGRGDSALDIYDEIISTAMNETDVHKAEDLYSRVMGGEYGS